MSRPMVSAVSLFLSAALYLALAISAEQHHGVPGRRTFAILLASVAFCLLASGLELLATDLVLQLLWLKLQFVGATTTVLAWFRFALQYAGHGAWLTRRRQLLVLVIPAFSLALVWTNQAHSLIWQAIRSASKTTPPTLALMPGPWLWVWLAFSHVLLLGGCALLWRTLRRATSLHRQQSGALLLAVLPPWLVNMAHFLGLTPVQDMGLIPFALVGSSLVLTWNMTHRRLLAFFPGLVPIAHDTIVESMRDGIVLLDRQNRVVDLNPAAAMMLGRAARELLGQPFDRLNLPISQDVLDLASSDGSGSHRLEVTLASETDRRDYDVAVARVDYSRRYGIGHLLMLHDVTERKQMVETLRQRDTELLMALEAGHLCVWEWLLPTGQISWSRVVRTPTGPELEQHAIDLDRLITSIHPDDRGRVRLTLERAIEERSAYHVDFRLLRPGGHLRWIEARGRVFYSGDGQPLRVKGVFADATKQKRAEAALAESEERLRLALSASGVATWDHDAATDTVVWSDEATALLGQPSTGPVDTVQALLQLVHPDDRPGLQQALAAGLSGETESAAEFRIVRPDGSVRWLASRGRAFRTVDGHPPRVLGTLMDVTERKSMEETLRASEARFRSLAEHAPIGILQVDRDGECIYANPSWQTLSGLSPSNSLRRGWLEAAAPQDRPLLDRSLTLALQAGRRFERDVSLLTATGARWARCIFAPILGEARAVLGGVITITDLTLTKRLEEQRKLLMLLEERERIAMDLHDGIIQSLYAVALRLASQERALSATQAGVASVLRQSRRDIDTVIREARNYIQALRPRSPDGPSLQDGLRLLVERLQGATGLEVTCSIDEGAARRLDSETAANTLYVAREAVSNAIRHARASRMVIRLAEEHDHIALIVEDNGQGFDAASRERRSGNGLRNMEERAALIGGHLEVRTRPGRGTHVRLIIPPRGGMTSHEQ